jgi:ethanolamine-phosphate cytidylyltransferase
MNLHERVLSVLGCRFVDDVLIDAPQVVSPVMISSLRIDEVVHGNNDDEICSNEKSIRYQYAKKAGIYVEIPSESEFSFSSILRRIQANQATFEAKITKKQKAEDEFYSQKYDSRSEIFSRL